MISILNLFEQKFKINAPTMAYKTLYGKDPEDFIRGREVSHSTYTYNNIQIDKNIPIKAIEELNKISDIETRSSCEGQDKRHPTFLIFRLMKDHTEKQIKDIVRKLNKYSDIKSSYDLGFGGKFRICITSNLWAGLKDFKKWWLTLPMKIRKSL